MPTRREFLTTVSALAAAAPVWAHQQAARDIRSPFTGPIGLQLWSLRNELRRDVPGTLATVRGMGFREVEGAGLWGQTPAGLKAALDAAGLKCQSAHMGYERLRDDLPGALAEVRAVGATWAVCPWIAEKVTREDIMRAADVFNRAARAAHDAGMRFAYHVHGYEFVPSADGTLFDTLAKATDSQQVEFQMDVFHAYFGGADPAQLIRQHGPRVTSLHLKDLKEGVPVVAGTAVGTPEVDVPVGTGQLDMPAILDAAMAVGTLFYYVEDESAQPLTNIPISVAYLEGFTPAGR
jgi:sugar phosphate isomerase/epimerase